MYDVPSHKLLTKEQMLEFEKVWARHQDHRTAQTGDRVEKLLRVSIVALDGASTNEIAMIFDILSEFFVGQATYQGHQRKTDYYPKAETGWSDTTSEQRKELLFRSFRS